MSKVCINEFYEYYELLQDDSNHLLILEEIVREYYTCNNEFILFFLFKLNTKFLLDSFLRSDLLVYTSLFTLWIEKRNSKLEYGKLKYYYYCTGIYSYNKR